MKKTTVQTFVKDNEAKFQTALPYSYNAAYNDYTAYCGGTDGAKQDGIVTREQFDREMQKAGIVLYIQPKMMRKAESIYDAMCFAKPEIVEKYRKLIECDTVMRRVQKIAEGMETDAKHGKGEKSDD